MKILINGKPISLTQLLTEHGIKNDGKKKISVKSGYLFEDSLIDRIMDLEAQLAKMLPKEPPIPQEPSHTEQEYIPFEGPASIWVDDNRDDSDKYRTVQKPAEQYQREMKKYMADLGVHKELSQQYKEQVSKIQSTPQYLRMAEELQALNQVHKAYSAAPKIPEWQEVKSNLIKAINDSGTSRKGGERIRAEIDRLEQLDLDPETKIARTIDFMLQEYRHILRSGLTGMSSSETGSRLAANVQNFSQKLGIELPKSLEKGQPLTLQSLRDNGKINEALYDHMTTSIEEDHGKRLNF